MLVPSTVLPLTMILGLPFTSARSDHQAQSAPTSLPPGVGAGLFSGCTGDQFWVNVTRRHDGDALISACPRCGDLCRRARAIRLRCDLREYPCTCRCPENQTFRTDINLCVDSFSDCGSLQSPSITFVDFPRTRSLTDAADLKNLSSTDLCSVRKTQVLKCGGWQSLDSVNITEGSGLWMVAKETDRAGRSVWWTGSVDVFQSLSGFVLNLDVSCDSSNTVTTSCIIVKMAGTRGYEVSMGNPSTTPPAHVVLDTTSQGETTAEGAISKWLVTSNKTAIGNSTKEMTDEEYKQLEMLVTAVCLSVALLLCVWLTCFALEKRVQSKKRGSEKQFASQTRTYTHEVSHCRKTLMDVYDMPMIRFKASKTSSAEEDETANLPVIQLKKKEKETVSTELKTDHEADGEESTSPSSSEQRMETGSSTETLASETTATAGQATYLGVPGKNATDKEFKNWRPCAKQQPASSLSPTKKKNPPGILKRSPNTSPTRSPSRSPPMNRRSPTKKGILIKRSPTLPKRWKTVVSRHLQHQSQPHHQTQPRNDNIEMKTVNGLTPEQPVQVPKRSILKHGSRWKALAPKLAPMVRAEEVGEDGVDEKRHHVVIKCEIHNEDERRETDPDSDEKAYTERSPLTKSIKMVLDSVPSKKNCIEWRRDDYDSVPCTDV